MCIFKLLSKKYLSSTVIPINDISKIVLMSDCHRGDGSWADGLSRNQSVYHAALEYYYDNGFTYIEIGDGDELWENSDMSMIIEAHRDDFLLFSKFHTENRFYMIFGNHDIIKKSGSYAETKNPIPYIIPLLKKTTIHEGLVLRYAESGGDIFLVHGHQADPLNSTFWMLARFLVRHIWKPLEAFGVNDPTSAAKNNKRKNVVEKRLTQWVQKEKCILVAGHTHRPVFPDSGDPLYFNSGSCVHPYSITAIEILDGSIALVKWHIGAMKNRVLYAKRDILAGPKYLKEFFDSMS